MKKQFTILSILIFAIFGCFALTGQTNAETEVGGIINSDTTWTLANSPYIITGTVQVPSDITLIIDQGVTVKVNSGEKIKIAGILNVNGSENLPIKFISNDDNRWSGIEFINSVDSYINNATIKNAIQAIELQGVSPVIFTGNLFQNNSSVITDSGGYQNMQFLNNTFLNNTIVFSGIRTLDDNRFENNIFVDNNSVFDYGYYFGNTVISNNNFINNNFIIKAPENGYGYGNVEILNNWWGTVNKNVIDNYIEDGNDDVSLQILNYAPIKNFEIANIGSSIILDSISTICTSWAYSDWSECVNGQQTRNIISSSPENCIDGNPILSQTCQVEIETNNNDTAAVNNNQTTENNNTDNSNNQNNLNSQNVIQEEKSLITKIDNILSKRISGNILLQVEKNGEGWYVYPDNKKKYYLGRPADAFNIMKNLGLGIKHSELNSYLNSKFPIELSGKIMLDVEQNGEAYYVNPNDLKGYYLNRPNDAFKIMRELGLGITNIDIRKIDVGEIE